MQAGGVSSSVAVPKQVLRLHVHFCTASKHSVFHSAKRRAYARYVQIHSWLCALRVVEKLLLYQLWTHALLCSFVAVSPTRPDGIDTIDAQALVYVEVPSEIIVTKVWDISPGYYFSIIN